jgi:hypothetical protein
MDAMSRHLPLLLVLGTVLSAPPSSVLAQPARSAGPAGELAQLLAGRKIDSFAARVPGTDDEFTAVLALPGQMIVVWAKFSAPAVLNEKILRGEYRDAYIDLNSASDPESRNMITDIGADGLGRGERNQPADSHDVGARSMRYDGNWRAQKMSEDDYMKAYAESDAAYTRALTALVAALKQAS